MKTTTLLLRHALLFCVFLFGLIGVSWGQVTFDWKSDAPDGNWKQISLMMSPRVRFHQ